MRVIATRFGAIAGLLGAMTVAPAAARPSTWSVTVLGPTDDPRYPAVTEAIAHWNEVLTELGASLRFGTVTPSGVRLPEDVLRSLSESVLTRRPPRLRRVLAGIPGDLVIALSNSDLVSVGYSPDRFGRAFVVLRRGDVPPLSLPNVARNVVTHEVGHVLGLRHNDDPGSLMCGRPADCWPPRFQSDSTRFFPLSEAELRQLGARWR